MITFEISRCFRANVVRQITMRVLQPQLGFGLPSLLHWMKIKLVSKEHELGASPSLLLVLSSGVLGILSHQELAYLQDSECERATPLVSEVTGDPSRSLANWK